MRWKRTYGPCVLDRKSTRLNSSHTVISYAVFCLKKKEHRNELPIDMEVVVGVKKENRINARPAEALNETFDLFIDLGAKDEQAEFPVVYAIGLAGRAGYTSDGLTDDLTPLFETIVKEIPAPMVEPDAPARRLWTTLEYDDYKGQIGVGRLRSGVMRKGMPIVRITPQGQQNTGKIQ